MAKRGAIQLFNYSFLDILATVIGVLLFIMILAILDQSGIAATSEAATAVQQAREELDKARALESAAQEQYKTAVARTEKVLRATESPLAKEIAFLTRENTRLTREIRQMQSETELLASEIDRIGAARAGAFSAASGSALMLPKATGGGQGHPYHIDCTSKGLIVIGNDIQSDATRRPLYSLDSIEQDKGAFGRLCESLRRENMRGGRHVMVLWVRPDGVDAFKKAYKTAKKAEITVGYEPADANWVF